MRILHTSDWHLGRSLEQVNRIGEQREFVDCLIKTVEEQRVDLVLVAGDIYDTYNPSAQAEELFYYAIDRLNGNGKRAVVLIAGNHDNPDRLCAASPLVYGRGIILLGYPGSDASEYENGEWIANSGPGWLEISIPGCGYNAVILTMPYPSESRLEEVLSREADESLLQKAYSDKIGSIFATLGEKFRDDTVNLIAAHLFLLGGAISDSERTLQVGGALTVDPAVIPEKAHFAALGHLHRPQRIRSEGCQVYYAGSPLAYSFSESGYSKAVYIVDAVPGEKAVVTPIYLDCGKPLRKWVADKGIGQAVKWCEEGRDSNAWIDLEIVTDRVLTAEEQKTLRNLHPGIINIRPRLKGEESVALSSQMREGRKIDELFRDYYKYRMGVEIPDDLMNAFLGVINDEESETGDGAGKEADEAVSETADGAGKETGEEAGEAGKEAEDETENSSASETGKETEGETGEEAGKEAGE